jgi:hypothetical protein
MSVSPRRLATSFGYSRRPGRPVLFPARLYIVGLTSGHVHYLASLQMKYHIFLFGSLLCGVLAARIPPLAANARIDPAQEDIVARSSCDCRPPSNSFLIIVNEDCDSNNCTDGFCSPPENTLCRQSSGGGFCDGQFPKCCPQDTCCRSDEYCCDSNDSGCCRL